jgi:hypothetical protein
MRTLTKPHSSALHTYAIQSYVSATVLFNELHAHSQTARCRSYACIYVTLAQTKQLAKSPQLEGQHRTAERVAGHTHQPHPVHLHIFVPAPIQAVTVPGVRARGPAHEVVHTGRLVVLPHTQYSLDLSGASQYSRTEQVSHIA